jgi:hypothetical protein
MLTGVELRVREQAYKMFGIPGVDMIALQMRRDIAKRLWVAINVQRSQFTSATLTGVNLLPEKMGEV